MQKTIAIVGRPNVGKSTLFNRLAGKRLALVDGTPGLTRDRREGDILLHDLPLRLIDTAGLEDADEGSLEARMRGQTEQAVEDADIVLFVIDAMASITPLDRFFADWLRRVVKPVILVANKCESRNSQWGVSEAHALGLGEPVAISAEHGEGLGELYQALRETIEGKDNPYDGGDGEDARQADKEGPMQVAIVGRPNVGKSTLINKLLGEDRVLTGPEAGITRDSIAIDWRAKDRRIRLVDTAGLRKKARISDRLEKLSVSDSLRTIRYAQVVVLLLDACLPMEKQDLTIARSVIDEGRALVVALNKWDLCPDRSATLRALGDRLERSLPQSRGIPIVTLSALQGKNLTGLLDAVFAAYDVWNRRIGTSELNRWLVDVTSSHPPPAPGGRRIRMKYATQAKSRPPTFAIFCSKPEDLPVSYLRYLENRLRDDFKLPGTPIRIQLRKGANPYAPKR